MYTALFNRGRKGMAQNEEIAKQKDIPLSTRSDGNKDAMEKGTSSDWRIQNASVGHADEI
jgi:hypothetical protein